jgi:hypothetical protein
VVVGGNDRENEVDRPPWTGALAAGDDRERAEPAVLRHTGGVLTDADAAHADGGVARSDCVADDERGDVRRRTLTLSVP